MIEEGALADILIVEGNPQEELTVLGGQNKWFLDKEVPEPSKTLCVIMKDGKLHKILHGYLLGKKGTTQ